MSILDVLVRKRMIENIDFEFGAFDALPCGPLMTLCNNAFINLASRFEDILSSSFDESPRGDKNRMNNVAENIMMLLTNSFYTLTWLNSKQFNKTNPNYVNISNET